LLDRGEFHLGKPLKNKFARIRNWMLRAYSNSKTNKILCFQTIYDRPEAVLPAMRTLRPYSNTPERKCQIIRDHDQFFDRPFRLSKQAAHGFAAQIHERLRFDEFGDPALDLGSANPRSALFAPDLCLRVLSKSIDQ
jgi:hypothetical protein